MSSKHPAVADAAYQGQPGAYSEEAARALLGPGATLLACPTLEHVFAAIDDHRVASAVVPIENTLAGAVPGVLGLLLASPHSVVAEAVIAIDHVLAGPAGLTLPEVRRVLSHPVALAQCQSFFRARPSIAAVPVFDTAGALEMVMQGPGTGDAAIASRRAATLYGASILAEGIQDHASNYTRFVHIAHAGRRATTGRQKIMLAFRLPHEPGSLMHALAPLAEVGVNLTRIDSRPVAGSPFEYEFFAEAVLEDGRHVARATDTLRGRVTAIRTIGIFDPAAQTSSF